MNDDGDERYQLPDGQPVILAQQRARIVTEATKRGGVQHWNIAQPLVMYSRRGDISRVQRMAGEKLEFLARSCPLGGRFAVSRYGETGGNADADNLALMPTKRLAALRAITPARARRLARLVCIEGHLAGRGNMGLLRAALDELARHFELEKKPLDRR